ncbi:MAG: DDE-type integrase/transposase/recombinase [Candidatus Eremiobacteraeota bacterium]|nr:DDE-type integrase/transposase/recombinase [Candidatus Eremiobacteraeota bacterium]
MRPCSRRSQSLIVGALNVAAFNIPFAMLGIDTDNDSSFINQTIIDFCDEHGIAQKRSRPYRKNDQAWVEKKMVRWFAISSDTSALPASMQHVFWRSSMHFPDCTLTTFSRLSNCNQRSVTADTSRKGTILRPRRARASWILFT